MKRSHRVRAGGSKHRGSLAPLAALSASALGVFGCVSSERRAEADRARFGAGRGPELGALHAALSTQDGGVPDPVAGSARVVASADTQVREDLPHLNFGEDGILPIQARGRTRALIGFDPAAVSGALAGALVRARLEVTVATAFDNWGPDRSITAHRMRRAWTELGATWSCADDADRTNGVADCEDDAWLMLGPAAQLPWQMAPTASALVPAGQVRTLELDVTRDVACSLAGFAPLQGWLLKKALESQSGEIDVLSSETTRAPTLILEWTLGAGVAVSAADCSEELSPPSGCTPRAPLDTSCDGVDDDCDGQVDDEVPIASSLCGAGICTSIGVTSCVEGRVSDSCAPGVGFADDALCNGLDEDCDGIVDEDFAGTEQSCGVGACRVTQRSECVLGEELGGCEPAAPAPADPSCDGVDDDCDGQADEDYVPVCDGTSVMSCVGGMLAPSDCSDHDLCNGQETCSDAACVPGVPPELDDANACTADGCDPASGALHLPLLAGTSCGDFAECDEQAACRSLLPPDPAELAPPVSAGFVSLFERMRFTFEGEPPIQTGVAPGAIEERRAAVVRGRVLDPGGQPLPGVRVSVHGHPEYGETLSRLDGEYDLMVNGGGALTLRYERDSFLEVQRTLAVPWQDYAFPDDVVLGPVAADVGVLAFPAGEFQVYRAAVVEDERGPRAAALFVPAGTSAEWSLADGTSFAPASLAVRATELSVGALRDSALPGPLPETASAAYAIELSADEAAGMGAVTFEPALGLYVDDFLDLPVGADVPLGAYDRPGARWRGTPDGRVIRVLEHELGLAVLDVDGSGTAADPAELALLGISPEEQQALAQLYAPGASFCRARVTELAPYAFAHPFRRDEGTGGADPEPPGQPLALDTPTLEAGSVETENQVLAQRLPLAGTGWDLHYRSDRTPGAQALQALRVPVSGAQVSPSFAGSIVEIRVAGQRYVQRFGADAGQVLDFLWDGKDGEGRAVHGTQRADIRVGLLFPRERLAPEPFESAFGQRSRSGAALAGDAGMDVRWLRYERHLRAFDDRETSVGGWSVAVHHRYDPVGKVLYQGDGTRRSGHSVADTIERFAGVPHVVAQVPRGDGGAALDATLDEPRALAVGPDGAVYIGTRTAVRRVDPITRVIRTVAGGKSPGACDPDLEEGPALDACLFVRKLDFGPDGGLYISDDPVGSGVDRLRRLDIATGQLRHIAGRRPPGGCSNSGDGGPARDAAICKLVSHATGPDGSIYLLDRGPGPGVDREAIRKISPNGIIETIATADWSGNDDAADVAVGPDGSLYVNSSSTVRRLSPTGEDRVFAGVPGSVGFAGDGGLATNALFGNIGPVGLTAAPGGRVFISDRGNRVLRVVEPNGIIRRFAGLEVNDSAAASGDGGSPLQAGLGQSHRTALGPDGAIYLTSLVDHTIRVIRPTLRGDFSPGVLIPSADGREAYRFDARGRHLETRSALTGGLLYAFGYDGAGRLVEIVDGDGNRTRIERDGSGRPTQVVAPFGQRTELATDGEGYLASVTDPSGAETSLTYAAGGLLVRKVDVRGGTHVYAYDARGRLASVAPAGNGRIQLEREGGDDAYRITRVSAAGLRAQRSVQRLPTETERRTLTREDGRTERSDTGRDQRTATTSYDGTQLTLLPLPDPVWGMARPLLGSFSERLPSAALLTASEARTVLLATASDPLSLRSSTRTLTVNGKVATLGYDAAARRFLLRSPRGRQLEVAVDEQARVTELTAPGLLPVLFSYDAAGRLAAFTRGARGQAHGYDANGHLVSIQDALGRIEAFSYDPNGRVTEQLRADGGRVGFDYDAAGNLTAVSLPGGRVHERAYTPRHQLESRSEADPEGGVRITSYVYDEDDRLVQVFHPDGSSIQLDYDAAGRLGSAELPGGALRFGYAASGHLQSIAGPYDVALDLQRDGAWVTDARWSGALSGSVGRVYDAFRRVSREAVNGLDPISFGYDDDGLLTSAGALALRYDANLPLLVGTTLGQVSDARAYDGHAELASYQARFAGVDFFSEDLVRDDLGRIVQRTETVEGLTTSYEYAYDELGQLLSVAVDGALARTYEYDAAGNRTSVERDGELRRATYDAQGRLLRFGDVEYGYAEGGALQTKTNTHDGEVTRYRYDALGNLLGIELPDGRSIEYLVDGFGRRVGKRVDGVLVRAWLYRGGPVELSPGAWGAAIAGLGGAPAEGPVAELDGAGRVVQRFVYASRADVPDYVLHDGSTYRIVSDSSGSVRRIVNVADAADVLADLSYDEFGVPAGTGLAAATFGFAGGVWDSDTGLLRWGGRDYDPELGRWLSQDAALLVRGENPQAFQPQRLACPNALQSSRVGRVPFQMAPALPTAAGLAIGGAAQGAGAAQSSRDGVLEFWRSSFWGAVLAPAKWPVVP